MMDGQPLLRRSGLLALLCLVPFAQGFAAGFEVRPVLVETGNGLGLLTVSNPGDTRIYIQGTLYRWSHNADGVDALAEAPDAIVSPPATWLEPKSEYRIRIKVPKAPPGQELAFRLLLTEVPERDAITSGSVVMAVTQSIPVFSQAAMLKSPSLSATITGSTLSIRNSGGRHLRIAQLTQDGQILKSGLVGYALSGSTLTVKLSAPIHTGRIAFTSDLGPQFIDVTE